jgi:plasmid stabilization system protein ParE
MTYEFHPDAESEFLSSVTYYEECQAGLGYDFAREIHSAVQGIVDYPEVWPLFYGNIRRKMVNRFPFAILFNDDNGFTYILAVMHLSRDPNYWKSRLT